MADRARNQHGLGKAVTFNVITPMTRLGTWVVALALWFFDFWKPSQNTAKQLAFLPFVHWVTVKRNCFPRLDGNQPAEQLNYDYLFFPSTFIGPWSTYIEAFADVLYVPLDTVWFWSVGYPFARPVGPLKAYIDAIKSSPTIRIAPIQAPPYETFARASSCAASSKHLRKCLRSYRPTDLRPNSTVCSSMRRTSSVRSALLQSSRLVKRGSYIWQIKTVQNTALQVYFLLPEGSQPTCARFCARWTISNATLAARR
jgi:hypothetical protein